MSRGLRNKNNDVDEDDDDDFVKAVSPNISQSTISLKMPKSKDVAKVTKNPQVEPDIEAEKAQETAKVIPLPPFRAIPQRPLSPSLYMRRSERILEAKSPLSTSKKQNESGSEDESEDENYNPTLLPPVMAPPKYRGEKINDMSVATLRKYLKELDVKCPKSHTEMVAALIKASGTGISRERNFEKPQSHTPSPEPALSMIKPDTILKVTFEGVLSPFEEEKSFTESQNDIIDTLMSVKNISVPAEKQSAKQKSKCVSSARSSEIDKKSYIIAVSGPPPAEVSTLGSIVTSISEQRNTRTGSNSSQYVSSSDKTVSVSHVVVRFYRMLIIINCNSLHI